MDFKPGTTCPGVQISHCMCQTTPQALEMHLGRNSLHMGISQERTLLASLIQFIPVSPKSTFARHLIGDDQQFPCTTAYLPSRTGRDSLVVDSQSSCPGAVSAFKGASHKDYLWAPSSGLKLMSRARARCKHGNRFLSHRKSWNLGIKSKEGSKEEAPFSFCCLSVQSHLAFQDDSEILPVLFCLSKQTVPVSPPFQLNRSIEKLKYKTHKAHCTSPTA